MRIKLDIIINGYIHLNLPVEGINITLKRNEFNLLTTNKAETRPLYITQTFDLPLEGNLHFFQELEGQEKLCQLLYNDVIQIYGKIIEYSVDNQKGTIQVSIVSRFKDVVDYMGDNVLFLDKIDLEPYNFMVPTRFVPSDSNELLKKGYYNPMDTNTGQIELSTSNIDGFCKPSLNILEYFKQLFALNKWTANWEDLPPITEQICLTPTVPYRCASFVIGQDDVTLQVQPGKKIYLDLQESNCIFNSNVGGIKAIDYPSPQPPTGTPLLANPFIFNMAPVGCTVSPTQIVGNGEGSGVLAISMNTDAAGIAAIQEHLNTNLYFKGYIRSDIPCAVNMIVFTTDDMNEEIVGSLETGPTEQEFSFQGQIKTSVFTSYGVGLSSYVEGNNATITYRDFNIYLPDGTRVATLLDNVEVPIYSVQVRDPNRLQAFKLKMLYTCPDPINIGIEEQGQEDRLLNIQSLGDSVLNQISDSINTKEGLSPLSVFIENPGLETVTVSIKKWRFYNLFNIYETNQDAYISPAGYYFPVADNFPEVTPLELYREMLILLQTGQRTNDVTRTVEFYQINDIFNKQQEVINLAKYIYWNGYETVGTPSGLAKLNVIRYKDDVKRQQYFKINLPQLPANSVYFNSLFAHSELNNAWGALTIPALKYKVKKQNDVTVEYLDWSDTDPIIGLYTTSEQNILQQSGNFGNTVPSVWNAVPAKTSIDTENRYNGFNSLKIVVGGSGSASTGSTIYYQLKTDTVYTYSAVIKSDLLISTNNPGMPLNFHGSKVINDPVPTNYQILAHEQQIVDGGWNKLYVTFKLTNNATLFKPFVWMRNTEPERVLNIACLNLVEGSVPKYRWSPHNSVPLQFNSLAMSNIVRKNWTNILKFLSSNGLQNPNVFKVKCRIDYYQYDRLMKQSNLFFYNGNAIMVDAEYDVINQTFTGTFINLK